MVDEVGRLAQYETFADEFLDHAADGFYNAHYDRPACLSLLGDVTGQRVLDAGCGPGLYARELVARGADLVGFDSSPRMLELARRQAPGARFRVHDLNEPLDWLDDDSVDLVLCALAFDHVDNRVGALTELRRVLRPGGALVLSRFHPTGDWLRHGGSYFQPRVIDETWSNGWKVRYWILPLEATCEEIHEAGFFIERLLEPRPTPDAAAVRPEAYEDVTQRPTGLITFRLRPRP